MITYIIIGTTVLISMLCFSNRNLFYRLSLSTYSVAHKNEWYRVITHAFVHANTPHLLINMLVLWSFGTNVELMFSVIFPTKLVGSIAYVSLYLGAILFASINDIIKRKDDYYYNSIGASGAVMAVVFTSIFFSPWSKIYLFAIIPIPAILFGVLYLWYESTQTKRMGDNINHHAHIYGAIFGLLFPVIVKPSLISHFITQLLNFSL